VILVRDLMDRLHLAFDVTTAGIGGVSTMLKITIKAPDLWGMTNNRRLSYLIFPCYEM
jgi:hypothetical protein